MVAMPPRPRRVHTLLIDNYDSYTYNLFQMLAEVNGVAPMVMRNDACAGDWDRIWAAFLVSAGKRRVPPAAELEDDAPALNIVVSPGPGHPANAQDFGVCTAAIRFAAATDVPLLGVCLGHQGLATVYGGHVGQAPEVMHGRTSAVHFSMPAATEEPLFAFVPTGFAVVRYHSLVAAEPLPVELESLAHTADGVLMALKHRTRPLYGVQFHPEAICSQFGHQLLQNFRDLTLGQAPTKCLLHHSGHQHHHQIAELLPSRSTPDVQRKEPKFQVVVECLAKDVDGICDFAESVFVALYAEAPRSFWLDSSSFQSVAAAASTASASSSARAARLNSRFSLMGDASGPLSYCVEFSALHQLLRIHKQEETVEASGHILTHVREQLAAYADHDVVFEQTDSAPFAFRGGFVGYLGYEVLGADLTQTKSIVTQVLEERWNRGDAVPDASLVFVDRVLVFDHVDQRVYAVTLSALTGNIATSDDAQQWRTKLRHQLDNLRAGPSLAAPTTASTGIVDEVVFHPSCSRDDYVAAIKQSQELINQGETYEVCLTNQLRADVSLTDPLAFYRVLRRRNPAPYAGFYKSQPMPQSTESGGWQSTYSICCSSPERFLRIDREGWMEAKPIKGTRRRGATPEEDQAIAQELATCVKDRAENMMIADLVRNDFGVVAAIGSVHVPKLMNVESYATVHQLVTTVRAQRRHDADIVDVLHATFPGGSMTGAPKQRTMAIIRELERHPRGVYSGTLGFMSICGSCDLNIIIRTAVVTPTSITLGAGGAIVALSDTDDEYDEMLLKARALVQTVGLVAAGDVGKARVSTDVADLAAAGRN
ncbi:TPA: hypothetical protein N0F65_001118 [Lagenidium giganteum]|uniref:aminodeoxychorismate synthase n=1 Tax=Lagenidium giganteum TaxID=4803 RepID=A0AAV2YMR7_9STRA|nr:TPA: hypothetical protein N0F65_001118 [Lagenidium giganteum]